MTEIPGNSFDQGQYYNTYKQIRNRFRKYDSVELISACIDYLYTPTKDQLQELQKLPWLVLLFVKWILIDDQFDKSGKKPLSRQEFYKLLHMVSDLGAVARLPSQFDHHTLFFRSMAYQQFLYQRGFSISHFARQKLLFSELPNNSLISSTFKKLTGVDIDTFLDLSLVALLWFVLDRHSTISLKWFSNVMPPYSASEVDCFLKSVSLPLLEVRKVLCGRDSRMRSAQEYYEQTPFLEFPLIQAAQQFLCVYPNVLFRCLEHFVYNRLKAWDAQQFMAKFGPMFEAYVENTIRYSGLPYISENDLKKEFCSGGNLVDFVIVDGDANIFVDAKAVEMSHQGKVSHLSEVIKDKTKASVLKAIKQAHDVLRQLQYHQSNHPLLKQRSQNYLIVITFKELYLGNGRTFYEAVAKNAIDEIYGNYSGCPTIQPEDMYFLTVEDFDIFAELIATGSIGLREGIERAKCSDADPKTKKFDFWLHVASWGGSNPVPSFLRSKSNEMFDKLRSIVADL